MSYPLFESLFRDLYRGYTVDTTIDPGDEMFRFTRERESGDWDRAMVKYFHDGLRVAWPLLDIGRAFFEDLSSIKVLDFASGYGRVTRHLIREIPPANLTISDIMSEGVRFQERQFGVDGIVSVTDPAQFVCDDRFDLIFVTSLFTHLPHGRFSAWLNRLVGLLTDRGTLLITVHDRSLLNDDSSDAPLVFRDRSESAVLSGAEYGTTWVTEDYVRTSVTAAGTELWCTRLPRALNNFHDIYAISRQKPKRDLTFDSGPEGHIDEAVIQGDALHCTGWIREISPWRSAERVEIWWNGELVAKTERLAERPDVARHFNDPRAMKSGFDLRVPLTPGRSFVSPLLIAAFSSADRFNFLHAGTVDSLLLRMLRDVFVDSWDPFAAPVSDVGAAVAVRERARALENRMAKLDRLGFSRATAQWRRLKQLLAGR